MIVFLGVLPDLRPGWITGSSGGGRRDGGGRGVLSNTMQAEHNVQHTHSGIRLQTTTKEKNRASPILASTIG